jgi:hypothetical protein
MRRRLALAALPAALAVLAGPAAAPALAHPDVALDPTLPTDLTYSATDNVEHLGRFPEHTGTAGGRPSQDRTRFYLTDPRGVYVYDTTTPANPRLLGSLPLYQTTTGAALAQEDVDTDGRVLLVDAALSPASTASQLRVVDVSDPARLRVLSSVPVTDHTWTCVSGTDAAGQQRGCAYAYGRTGHIVDLRDPAAARLLDVTWRQAVGYGDRGNPAALYTHDLTEIRPGLVMTAGRSAILMDTTDPTAPVRLTAIEQEGRFTTLGYHSVVWANGGRDPHLVLGTEIGPSPVPAGAGTTENTAGSDCEGENSVIETWDARAVVKALKNYERSRNLRHFDGVAFSRVDTFDATGRGLFLDGQAPASQLYCAHWMELEPAFDGGGRMAVAYYNRGTRFVDVAPDGTMTEIGWITPAESYAGSPQWISDDVVYVMDYRRGLEVVRLTDAPATGTYRNAPDLIALASSVRSTAHPHPSVSWLAPVAALALLVALERRTRRRLAAAERRAAGRAG